MEKLLKNTIGQKRNGLRINKVSFSLSIIIIFICLIVYGLCTILSAEQEHIYILSLLVSIVYIFFMIYLVRRNGPLSLVALFWMCLGLFGVARPIMYVFGILDFTNENYSIIGKFEWSYEISVIVLHAYLIFMLVFINISIRVVINYNIINRRDNNLFRPIIKIVYSIYYVCAPILAFYYFKQVTVVIRLGYTSYYNGTAAEVMSFGILFSLARLIFTVAFYIICCTEKRIKYFDTACIIYLAVNGILILQGSRIPFLVTLMTCFFLKYRIFQKGIKFKWILIGIVVSIPMLQLVSYIRSGIPLEIDLIFKSYRDFISGLSNSINVPAYYLQHRSELPNNTYPYICEPLVRVVQYFMQKNIQSSGQSIDMIAVRFNLGHQITWNISRDYYLSGANVASNFIAEMLEFGLLGVFIFSIIISKLIIATENQIIIGRPFFRFMCFELCRWIFVMPRAESFYDTYNLLKYGLIFTILCLFAKSYKAKKRLYDYGKRMMYTK